MTKTSKAYCVEHRAGIKPERAEAHRTRTQHRVIEFKGCATPSMASLERIVMSDGACPALDGCRVEVDGSCEHGLPSWTRHLGIV